MVTLGIWSWAVLVGLEVCVSGLSFENFCLYYRLGKRMAIVSKRLSGKGVMGEGN